MHTKTHRHFVAFPIAVLLMLSLSVVQAVLPAGATEGHVGSTALFRATKTPVDFHVGWMLRGTLEPDSALRTDKTGEHSELLRGEVLLLSRGMSQLTLGTVTVHALNSPYVALRQATTLTVVPLTYSVIVTHGDQHIIVIPGMQLTVDAAGTPTVSTVPTDWYAHRLQAAKLLPESSLPASLESMNDRENMQVSLAHLLTGSRMTAPTFLQAIHITNALDPTGESQRLLFLRLVQEESKADAEATQALSEKVSDDPLLMKELMSALPFMAMFRMRPIAEIHVRQWEKSVLSLGLRDTDSAISLLQQYAALPHLLTRAGYPKQSLLWQSALRSVAINLRATVSGQDRTDIDDVLAIIAQGDMPKEQVTLTKEPVPEEAMTHWSEKQLIAIVSSMLLSHDVLMAVTTVLAPDTPTQTVRVTGVFIAEHGADIPYAFSVDVTRGLITNIIRDGKKLPNAVPIDVFFP